MKTKILCTLCSLIILSSCATTSIASIMNPKYKAFLVEKILVHIPLSDLELRRHAEQEFKTWLELQKIKVEMAIDYFPPIKQYSKEETYTVLKNNSISGILLINLLEKYTEPSYVPQTSKTTSTSTKKENIIYGESETTTVGGYYISLLRNSFEIVLYETNSEEIIWKATTNTSGDRFSNEKTLLTSLAQTTAFKISNEVQHLKN